MTKEELLEHKFQNLRSIVMAVTGQDVCENSRKREVVDARRIFCTLIYGEKNASPWKYEYTCASGLMTTSYISVSCIGRFLGRDHATVLHMLKTCSSVLEVDANFKEAYDKVYSRFGRDVFKRLHYINGTIEKLKKDLETLEKQRDYVLRLKKEQDEKSEIPKQGVLFEVSYNA